MGKRDAERSHGEHPPFARSSEPDSTRHGLVLSLSNSGALQLEVVGVDMNLF
ncbi:hypothetical protein [Sphingomonas carotinifaciens]|uniref:hypothetical protein n=1 Tax=Sphingomonas carotinifaciens TaxID=1166323 RepID=UPI00196726EB|nr:hypothetical protein [Sphingomonas carotinifaciens]